MAASHTEVWQQASVTATASLTAAIRRIELRPDRPVPVAPGAHVDVEIEIDGARQTRSYSVVDADPDGGRIALSVFRSSVSRGGAVVMHALRPGDRVRMTQPINDFPLRLGAAHYVLLAGGVGITAILGMADQLRRTGADYRLVYAGRHRDAMAYLERARTDHGDVLDVHVGAEGTTLSVEDLVAGLDRQTELYVCGPIRLMDAVRRAWTARALPAAHLRSETFGNSGWFAPEPFRVRLATTGLEVEVGADETMLEALTRAGADLMYDCRKGECGLCEARVAALSGDIDHRDVFYSERQRAAREKICLCVSRVVAAAGTRAAITIVPS